MCGVWVFNMLAWQAWLYQRRLTVELLQANPLTVGDSVGHRKPRLMQAFQQLDKERQGLNIPALNQRQYIIARAAADEEVTVFATTGNAGKLNQPAQLKTLQEGL